MKCNGYTLIGLEQTANSLQLNKYTFPKKSLLVLGFGFLNLTFWQLNFLFKFIFYFLLNRNEKEGIPVDIIQMLDVCLEIPQLGVIRSLNVHVSAAIAIWEFTKQRLIDSN